MNLLVKPRNAARKKTYVTTKRQNPTMTKRLINFITGNKKYLDKAKRERIVDRLT